MLSKQELGVLAYKKIINLFELIKKGRYPKPHETPESIG
jgi:hypothetical protein